MEDLLIQEMLKNIIARIFMKNIKKIRSLNTEASKKMTDVYDQVRKIFITPSYDEIVDETDDKEDEQPEITDMLEEYAELEGQG